MSVFALALFPHKLLHLFRVKLSSKWFICARFCKNFITFFSYCGSLSFFWWWFDLRVKGFSLLPIAKSKSSLNVLEMIFDLWRVIAV
jgi:hypothetical protein